MKGFVPVLNAFMPKWVPGDLRKNKLQKLIVKKRWLLCPRKAPYRFLLCALLPELSLLFLLLPDFVRLKTTFPLCLWMILWPLKGRLRLNPTCLLSVGTDWTKVREGLFGRVKSNTVCDLADKVLASIFDGILFLWYKSILRRRALNL